jgi:5,5'-dehydrodivanillate O-demethylase
MLSCEENELLTQVGPGTPAGELLRRYWYPVAVAAELSVEKPVKAIKILGEELAIFRLPVDQQNDKKICYGLVGRQCPHRSASLAYGRVEPDGIRCVYHGWKFDVEGRCLEQPAEPPGSSFKERIRHKAYPVQKLAGLLFAYMGPSPAPLLPRYDVYAREDGKRWLVEHGSLLRCNWLQAMENSVDPAHLFWLHRGTGHLSHMEHYSEKDEFIPFEHGIWKRRTTPGKTPGSPEEIDQHPLVFPNILRNVVRGGESGFVHVMQIRVPVDDTNTRLFRVCFTPTETDRSSPDDDPPLRHEPLRTPDGEYDLKRVAAQDMMAWETQGPVTNRTQEHLGASDEGIIMFRKLLREQIELVQRGGEPLGVVRDPEKNRIIHFNVINERRGLRAAS